MARFKRMARGVKSTARIVTENLCEEGFRYRAAMVMLSYAKVEDWQANHIREFIKRMREWARRRDIHVPYVWVMELQERGAVHYHIIIWLPRGYTIPMPDKQGWWKHGLTSVQWARRPVGYLAKYASKLRSKCGESIQLPYGARLWGSGGLTLAQKIQRGFYLAPQWLQNFSSPGVTGNYAASFICRIEGVEGGSSLNHWSERWRRRDGSDGVLQRGVGC